MTKSVDKDTTRLTLFPAMDYKGLYNALVLLIDDASLLHIGLQGLLYILNVNVILDVGTFYIIIF